jgi:RNA polymerase nonessential primary-like sigma factor
MPAPQKLPRGSCDAISLHLHSIGRIPLLTHEEEITLGRAVQGLRQLNEIAEELTMRSGGIAPTDEAWAIAADLTLLQLKRGLRIGTRAKQRMVTANLRLVVTVARKYFGQQLELDDLIQEGNLGLIKAVDRFDPTRGYKFSTYAYWWIREGITRAIADKSRTIRLPVHIGDSLSKLRRAQQILWQSFDRPPSLEELSEETGFKPLDIREMLFRAQQPVSLDDGLPVDDDTTLLDRLRCNATQPGDQLTRTLLHQDLEKLLTELPGLEAQLLRLRYGINQPEPMTLSAVARTMGITRDTARGVERRAMAAVQERSQQVVDYIRA